jgi:hypothetical protein
MEHQMAVNSRTVHTLEKQENEMKWLAALLHSSQK